MHKRAPCASDVRSGRWADRAGQHGATSLFWARTSCGDTGETAESPGNQAGGAVRAIEKQLVLYGRDCPLEITHRIQAGHQGQVQSRPCPAWSRSPRREQKRPPARVQDGEIVTLESWEAARSSRGVEEGLSRSFSGCGGKPSFPSTSAGDLRELPGVPLRGEGSCGGKIL